MSNKTEIFRRLSSQAPRRFLSPPRSRRRSPPSNIIDITRLNHRNPNRGSRRSVNRINQNRGHRRSVNRSQNRSRRRLVNENQRHEQFMNYLSLIRTPSPAPPLYNGPPKYVSPPPAYRSI